MRNTLGNSKIKTFVTHDFFLNVVRGIVRNGTGAAAIIAATMTSSAVKSRLPQPTVSVISIGALGHLPHPNWCNRLGNQQLNSRRRDMTQAMLANGITAEKRVGIPAANHSGRPPLLLLDSISWAIVLLLRKYGNSNITNLSNCFGWRS